jgi:hypothetical protein
VQVRELDTGNSLCYIISISQNVIYRHLVQTLVTDFLRLFEYGH